eukprot:GAHX01001465.1.p1 GENE.GAHX01001465.1~~GAHX01001465.1.p1  ORF type:complete len:533 (-),score=78.37 GAHX01001465.1:106-1704(-)
MQFRWLQKKVVVLIDEYDSVFQDFRYPGDKLKDKQRHIEVVIEFYRSLKENNKEIYLLFMTGITNLFFNKEISPLTGWKDYSFEPETAELVGFTKEEIINSFNDCQFMKIYTPIKNRLSKRTKNAKNIKERVIKELRFRYDGYRFTRKPVHVFNSEAIIQCFNSGKMEYFWSKQLTSGIQWDELSKEPRIYNKLVQGKMFENIKKDVLTGSDKYLMYTDDKCIAILYQTGLLTIEKVIKGGDFFNLKIPNNDVEIGLKKAIVFAIEQESLRKVDQYRTRIIDALENDDWGSFFTYLRSVLQSDFSLPDDKHEPRYTRDMNTALKAIGIKTADEGKRLAGSFRMDIFFKHNGNVYIIENKLMEKTYKTMKRDKGSDQIISRYYVQVRSKNPNCPIYLIGINFQKKPITNDIKVEDIRKKFRKFAKKELNKDKMANLKLEVKGLDIDGLKNKLFSFFPNPNSIDNFYMKRIDDTVDGNTISHLEGYFSEKQVFEIKSEDSYPRHRNNRYLANLIDAPEILFKKREDRAVNKKQK